MLLLLNSYHLNCSPLPASPAPAPINVTRPVSLLSSLHACNASAMARSITQPMILRMLVPQMSRPESVLTLPEKKLGGRTKAVAALLTRGCSKGACFVGSLEPRGAAPSAAGPEEPGWVVGAGGLSAPELLLNRRYLWGCSVPHQVRAAVSPCRAFCMLVCL